MKGILFAGVMLFTSQIVLSQTSAYLQQFQSQNGNQISLNAYARKKVLIVMCSAYAPNLSWLQTLDNLNKNNASTLQVIVIPILDLDSTISVENLQPVLFDTMHFSFIISKPGNGKKSSGAAQLPLLKWLTNKSGNIHFDNDLQYAWQMFVIGENGILYAELFGPDDLTNGNLTYVLTSKAPSN